MKIIYKETYNFSIDVIDNYQDDENAEFGIIRLNFLSDGYNSHNIPFTTELLKKYAPTIIGKPIVAKYNNFKKDVEGHESDEIIVGYVPSNAQITYESSANGTFACVDGLISKIYATNVYELYKQTNHRNVSVEVMTEWNGNEAFDGDLVSFNIVGVTLLGLQYEPSCTLASSKIVQFSLESVNKYYDNYNTLNKYIQQRRYALESKTYKVNTEELKDTPWGGVDKTKLRNTIMDADNKSTLVHKVYALVESGWEEAPSEKLKYPLMQLVGDTFYYNRGALSSALGYAKAQNESSVVSKVESIYKKFNLTDDDKGGNNKMAIEGRKAWGEVIKKVQSHEGDGAYVDSVEKDHIIYTKGNVRYHVDADVEVGKDDDMVHATIKWDTVKKDADQKMGSAVNDKGGKDDSDKDGQKKDDKLSSDKNDDLEGDKCCDTMSVEELKKKVEDQENIIMQYEQELESLRDFKKDTQMTQQKFTVDKTMQKVKADLSEAKYSELQEEGMKCAFEELSAWENKVKATAYELSTQNPTKRADIWSMGGASNIHDKPSSSLWD